MRVNVLWLGALILLLGACGSLMAADSPEDEAKTELQKFQGTWVLVSGEIDGKKVAEEHVKQSKITFDGNKMMVDTPHQSKETIVATITKLDPTKTPKEMHWVRTTGPNAGTTMIAIYEFEGADQYKIRFDPAGKTVPKEFGTTEGTGHIWHTWRRVKQ